MEKQRKALGFDHFGSVSLRRELLVSGKMLTRISWEYFRLGVRTKVLLVDGLIP